MTEKKYYTGENTGDYALLLAKRIEEES